MTNPKGPQAPRQANLAVLFIGATAVIVGMSIGISFDNTALGVAVGVGVVILLGLLEWAGRKRLKNKSRE